MLNKLVEVKEMNLIGTVIDFNEKFITIENDQDIYIVAAAKVEDHTPAFASTISNAWDTFEAALTEANISFDGYTEGDYTVTYMIEGFTYSIMINLDFETETFSLETKHKGLDRDDEKEWCNKVEYKKLSTLVKNTIKWTDK
jgi:hypothetical protein